MSNERAPKGTISLALPMGDRPEPHTARTWLEMVMYDREFGSQHLHPNRPYLTVAGAGFITNARNELVRQFLAQPEDNRADWLLFLDDDQLYPEHLLEILIASADPVERRIVAMPVWRFITNDGGPVRVTHNVFDVDEQGGIIEWVDPFPPNAVIQVGAIGSGCMLIHRTALEETQQVAIANGRGAKWCWFVQQVYLPADVAEGEDVWFCRLAAASGIAVWMNTSMTLQHAKTIMLQGPAPAGSLSIGGEPGWFHSEAVPEAVEAVDVIVPVLHRPQNVKPLMDSLKATAPLATAWFVCEPDDLIEWAEVEKHGGKRLVHPGTFAEKVNYAYGQTSAPWLMLVGDDVVFRRGWLDQAEHVAAQTGGKVIGTNDLGNARVMAGEHATHMMIRRSYIDDVGASWDGPGVVCHEGYSHWFVDDELISAAKQRNTFQPALGSIVEHMHPYWGKADKDDVYAKGEANAAKDKATFNARYRKSLASI